MNKIIPFSHDQGLLRPQGTLLSFMIFTKKEKAVKFINDMVVFGSFILQNVFAVRLVMGYTISGSP